MAVSATATYLSKDGLPIAEDARTGFLFFCRPVFLSHREHFTLLWPRTATLHKLELLRPLLHLLSMQRVVMFPLVLLMVALTSFDVSAHVVVHPREAKAGSYEVFMVRCPNEKDKATLKLELEIPVKDVAIHHYEAKPGWKIALEKNSDGDAVKVTWTAEGEGVLPDQFVEFRIMGKIGADAQSLVWKAHQTYAGDEVVAWTGESGSKTPASVTKLNAAAKSADAAAPTTSANDGKAKLAFNVALGAVMLSVIALLIGIMKR